MGTETGNWYNYFVTVRDYLHEIAQEVLPKDKLGEPYQYADVVKAVKELKAKND